MKWGFASTAALVLAQQKDSFYANQLSEELKTVALDWLGRLDSELAGCLFELFYLATVDIRTFLKWEEWIEALGRVLYWLLLTGSGHRSLGEEYIRISPVDMKSRSLFLENVPKRLAFALLSVLLPFVLKGKHYSESVEVLNAVHFYWTGKFPTLLHRLFSIRYVKK